MCNNNKIFSLALKFENNHIRTHRVLILIMLSCSPRALAMTLWRLFPCYIDLYNCVNQWLLITFGSCSVNFYIAFLCGMQSRQCDMVLCEYAA